MPTTITTTPQLRRRPISHRVTPWIKKIIGTMLSCEYKDLDVADRPAAEKALKAGREAAQISAAADPTCRSMKAAIHRAILPILAPDSLEAEQALGGASNDGDDLVPPAELTEESEEPKPADVGNEDDEDAFDFNTLNVSEIKGKLMEAGVPFANDAKKAELVALANEYRDQLLG